MLDALMKAGQALECNECADRKESTGYYCDFCPLRRGVATFVEEPQPLQEPAREPMRRKKDDSIVLL